jgi:hypothetical protein
VVEAARPFFGPTRHVARMRSAELVVDYLEGPHHPDPLLRYGAIFKASEDADAAFASSEPPTHDCWVETGLKGTSRGVVQGARRFVYEQIEAGLGLGAPLGGSGGRGLGELSARLASLVPAMNSTGASQAVSESHDSVRPARTAIQAHSDSDAGHHDARVGGSGSTPNNSGPPRLIGSPHLEVENGIPRLVARVQVQQGDAPRYIRAEVSVVVEGGGRETEAPTGASVPAIVRWVAVDGSRIVEGDTLTTSDGDGMEWSVYATYVPDAVVRFRLDQVGKHAR